MMWAVVLCEASIATPQWSTSGTKNEVFRYIEIVLVLLSLLARKMRINVDRTMELKGLSPIRIIFKVP